MRIIAVDFGDARTGLAICDSGETIASPIGNVEGKNLFRMSEGVADVCRKRNAEMVVVGLPINMDGTEGPRADKCRKFASVLAKDLNGQIPVVMWDERITTVQAYRNLLDSDVHGKKKRHLIDAEAARLILENYLSYRKNNINKSTVKFTESNADNVYHGVVFYVHGKGGSAGESVHYETLFPGYKVIGIDYHSVFPWIAGEEIRKTVELSADANGENILIANSLGAYLAMDSGIREVIKRAYFISPIVDMEAMITGMMKDSGVTEKTLEEEGTLLTESGEELSWQYLCYVRDNPICWSVPTYILCAEKDSVVNIELIRDFAEKHRATIKIMENGEHWFHTREQMRYLDNWILDNEKKQA